MGPGAGSEHEAAVLLDLLVLSEVEPRPAGGLVDGQLVVVGAHLEREFFIAVKTHRSKDPHRRLVHPSSSEHERGRGGSPSRARLASGLEIALAF
jgi:hypothetical protein